MTRRTGMFLLILLSTFGSTASIAQSDEVAPKDLVPMRATWPGLEVDFYVDGAGEVVTNSAAKFNEPKVKVLQGAKAKLPLACEVVWCDDDKPPFCLYRNCSDIVDNTLLNVPSDLLEAGFGVEFLGSPALGNQSVRLVTEPSELKLLEKRFEAANE